MKKGSYGRSKLIGHSPIQRKWNLIAYSTNFTDISYLAIFYVNCDNTNILTINDIGSPIASIPINQLKVIGLNDYSFDITKLIQIYNRGCYFFAWVDTSGQIQDNQLLLSNNSGDDYEECLIFTPAFETLWRNGAPYNPITLIRGVYIKNPALPMNIANVNELNELRLQNGDPQK